MLIESLIKRAGGTSIKIGDDHYHFDDNGRGAHICNVDNDEHIQTLLSISEGFSEYVADNEIKDGDAVDANLPRRGRPPLNRSL